MTWIHWHGLRKSKLKSPVNHKNLEQNRFFISKDPQDCPSQRFSQRKLNWLAPKQSFWPLLWSLSLIKSQILMFLCRGLLQHFPQIEIHASLAERREEKHPEVNQSQVLYGAQMQLETSWMCGWNRNRAFVWISAPSLLADAWAEERQTSTGFPTEDTSIVSRRFRPTPDAFHSDWTWNHLQVSRYDSSVHVCGIFVCSTNNAVITTFTLCSLQMLLFKATVPHFPGNSCF